MKTIVERRDEKFQSEGCNFRQNGWGSITEKKT